MERSSGPYSWFEIKARSPLRLVAGSTGEQEELSKDAEQIIRKQPTLGESSWLCTSIVPLEEAVKKNKFTLFPGSPEKLLRLFNDGLSGWNGALGQNAPQEPAIALHHSLLEHFASGDLDAHLENFDGDKRTGWDNSRIVDAEAWAEFDFQESASSRLIILDHGAGRLVVQRNQVAETEKPTLLAFRSWRLLGNHQHKDYLVYRVKGFPWGEALSPPDLEQLLVESHLLSGNFIVQRICTYQKELFSTILDYLEDRQIFITWTKGTDHIIEFLSAYSRVIGGGQTASLRCPEFLSELEKMGHLGLERLISLQDLTEDESERIQAIAALDNRVSGDRKLDFIEFFGAVARRREIVPNDEEAESQLATINYAPGRCLVCSRIQDLPEPDHGAEYPTLFRNQVVPVFISKRRSISGDIDRPLHDSFRRNIMVVASVRRYKIVLSGDLALDLAVGHITRSFSSQDVEGALSTLLSRRIPLHERRAFHLLHLPGRESLDDLEVQIRDQLVAGSPPSNPSSFLQALTSDQAVGEAVSRILSFRTELEAASSQEEISLVLGRFPIQDEGHFPIGATVPSLLVLENLLRLDHLEHEGLIAWVSSAQQSFRRSGRHVMATLAGWTLMALAQGPAALKEKDLAKVLRTSLWFELHLAFPDTHEWADAERPPRAREGEDQAQISDFASVVLSGVFHRPFVVAYHQTRELPRRHLRLALESIQRINLLTAVFPICCGDWADSRYFDLIQKAHRAEESRIFASISGTRSAEQDEYLLPYPDLSSGSSFCSGSRCKHALNSTSAFLLLLWRIGALTRGRLQDLQREVARCGFWLNSLFDHLTHRHFRCQHCGMLLSPDPSSDHPDRFNCPLALKRDEEAHDKDVYLSWCRGSGCSRVIDSRGIGELNRCSTGKYICPECKSCCGQHDRQFKAGDQLAPACRNCRRELTMQADNTGVATGAYSVVECVCKTKNHIYGRWDREQSGDELSALSPRDFDGIFRYNTRPLEQEKG